MKIIIKNKNINKLIKSIKIKFKAITSHLKSKKKQVRIKQNNLNKKQQLKKQKF